jgi:hypothetical protein
MTYLLHFASLKRESGAIIAVYSKVRPRRELHSCCSWCRAKTCSARRAVNHPDLEGRLVPIGEAGLARRWFSILAGLFSLAGLHPLVPTLHALHVGTHAGRSESRPNRSVPGKCSLRDAERRTRAFQRRALERRDEIKKTPLAAPRQRHSPNTAPAMSMAHTNIMCCIATK